MTIKEKADELISLYISINLSQVNDLVDGIRIRLAIKCAILSVEHTIEVLERIKRTDKEAGRLLHVTSQIELDEQTELLTELKSRL